MNSTPQATYRLRDLSQAYVSLILARMAAERYASGQPADPLLRALLNSLHLTAELLEACLQSALPEEDAINALPIACSELLM